MNSDREDRIRRSAEAAALALPPLSDEAIAEIARVLAGIEARRHKAKPKPDRAAA